MKKTFLFMILFLMLTLVACGGSSTKTVDVVDYLEVDFEGMDSIGKADYTLDVDAMMMDILDIESKDEAEEKIESLSDDDQDKFKEFIMADKPFEVTLSESENLSNGDKVEVTVEILEGDDYINGGSEKFTVENLEEPEILTSEEVKKHIVIEFIGADGKGFVKLENLFKDNLAGLTFEVDNDGELSNGDKAELKLSENTDDNENKTELIELGYKLEDNFKVEKEVKDLPTYAKNAKDIKNFKDLVRIIDERAEAAYNDSTHDYKKGLTFYRQFDDEVEPQPTLDDDIEIEVEKHGTLVTLYDVTEYIWPDNKTKDNVRENKFRLMGYNNLQVNEDGEVDISEIEEIGGKYSHYYDESEETLKQKFEADGFELVE